MLTRLDPEARSVPGRCAWAALVVAAALAAGSTWSIAAQEETPATATDTASLRSAVEEVFEVLPVSNGVVLKPLGEADYRAIEVSGRGVAVDGAPLPADELAARLGADGDLVARLADLEPAALRRLWEAPTGTAQDEGAGESSDELEPADEMAETEVEPDDEAAAEDEVLEDAEVELEPIHVGKKVTFGSDLTIAEGEVAQEVVVIGGSLNLEGEVEREVTVMGGDAHVEGTIGRSIQVINGDLFLGPNAVVGRDVQLVGGRLHREPGARIEGSVDEVGWFDSQPDMGRWFDFDQPLHFRPMGHAMGVIWDLLELALYGLVLCLVALAFGNAMRRVELKVEAEPLKTLLVGVVFQVLFVPLLAATVIFLAISVIGIPLLLLVPFLLLFLFAAALVGFTGVCLHLGSRLGGHFGWDLSRPYVALLVGFGLLATPGFLAEVLDVPGAGAASGLLCALALVILYLAWTMGLGAWLMTYVGQRRRGIQPPPLPPLAPPPGEPIEGENAPAPTPPPAAGATEPEGRDEGR